ncbi:MAG TPA: hypothetical protein VGG03_05035 [Thermoanaerobaculia bacterium]|jgi:hypothetical protein
MNPNNAFLRPLVLAAFVATATASSADAIWPNDHLNQAEDWIFDPYVDPANNSWDVNPYISVEADGVHARTKCGSFTALLLKNAYSAITDQVLTDLTGSNSPAADEWYAAIRDEKTSPSGIQFHKRTSVASIQAGDILASAYTMTGDTGHVMTVKSVTLAAANTTLPAGKTIDGVGAVNRYEVTVYDSTKSPHGAYSSNPAPDTRYKQVQPGGTIKWVNDQGIGSGTIVIYEEASGSSQGRIVAWAWNVSPTTDSYYYAVTVTANPGGWGYRPMVAGSLDGPGL